MYSSVLLSSAYLPPVQYFSKLLNAERVLIEKCEHFEKQSYRNRCTVYGANGQLDLIVPLVHGTEKTRTDQKKISYVHPWKNLHWKSICSAYRSSPYFEYFEQDFESVYNKQHELLFDLNMELLQLVLRLLKQDVKFEFTAAYEKTVEGVSDFRSFIHPKADAAADAEFKIIRYYQVFESKNGFLSNLSILDLLFNEGLNSLKILKESCLK